MLKYFLVLFFVGWRAMPEHQSKKHFRISGRAQGTTYSISYLNKDSIVAKAEVDSIFHAIDLSLSLYEPASLINRFNREGMVKMDHHMQAVVKAALEIEKLSCGGFDITVKNLVDLWGFGVKGGQHLPGDADIRKALRVTGSRNLILRNDTLVAVRKNVQIDCNGIAQGYSVDCIFHFLETKGLEDIIVEVGGEVRAKGRNAKGEKWRVGIESPAGITEDWYPVNEIAELDNLAVTTSGNYRKYFTDHGKKFSHVIDPRTGMPVDNGIISVTVIAPDAITADGWDNGFYVMGIDSSFSILKKYSGLELMIIYRDKNGYICDTASAGFKELMVN
jgi:thiamine biosynthesis lipoprotein